LTSLQNGATVQKARLLRPGFFLVCDCGCYFATRSLASEVPIELNTLKVWLALVTRKNLSVPLAQYSRAHIGTG
jgi:hypothetical protein